MNDLGGGTNHQIISDALLKAQGSIPPGHQRPDNVFVLASKVPGQDNSKGPTTPAELSMGDTGKDNFLFKLPDSRGSLPSFLKKRATSLEDDSNKNSFVNTTAENLGQFIGWVPENPDKKVVQNKFGGAKNLSQQKSSQPFMEGDPNVHSPNLRNHSKLRNSQEVKFPRENYKLKKLSNDENKIYQMTKMEDASKAFKNPIKSDAKQGLPPINNKSKATEQNRDNDDANNSFEMKVKYLEKQFGVSLAVKKRQYSDDESSEGGEGIKQQVPIKNEQFKLPEINSRNLYNPSSAQIYQQQQKNTFVPLRQSKHSILEVHTQPQKVKSLTKSVDPPQQINKAVTQPPPPNFTPQLSQPKSDLSSLKSALQYQGPQVPQTKPSFMPPIRPKPQQPKQTTPPSKSQKLIQQQFLLDDQQQQQQPYRSESEPVSKENKIQKEEITEGEENQANVNALEDEIQRLYHENNAIKMHLRDFSEQLTQEIDKAKQGKKNTPPKGVNGGPTSYKVSYISQAAYEQTMNSQLKILKIAEQEYESLKKLQRKVVIDTGSNQQPSSGTVPFQGEIEASSHYGEFQLQKRILEISEEITQQQQFKNDNEKRIKQTDKEITRITNQQDQNTHINMNSRYTSIMKDYLSFKDQTENMVQKLDNQSMQKEVTIGRINELRFILDSYKEELRDYCTDPDAEIANFLANNVPQSKNGGKKDQEEDPTAKKVKELQDRMNDLRRWHNSKQHILEIKIKDQAKIVQELEMRKRELEVQLKQKLENALKKAGQLGEKGKKQILSQPTAKFLKNQLTINDLPLSPEQKISPFDQQNNFMQTVNDQDSFGEGPKYIKNLPKYFNVLNEDDIEKKTFYQDDQSNMAEARSLLKALDRDLTDDDSKKQLKTVRILEGISTHIRSSDSIEQQSVILPGNLAIPKSLLNKRAPSSSQNLNQIPKAQNVIDNNRNYLQSSPNKKRKKIEIEENLSNGESQIQNQLDSERLLKQIQDQRIGSSHSQNRAAGSKNNTILPHQEGIQRLMSHQESKKGSVANSQSSVMLRNRKHQASQNQILSLGLDNPVGFGLAPPIPKQDYISPASFMNDLYGVQMTGGPVTQNLPSFLRRAQSPQPEEQPQQQDLQNYDQGDESSSYISNKDFFVHEQETFGSPRLNNINM